MAKKNNKKKEASFKESWNQFGGACRVWGNEFETKKGDTYIAASISLSHENDDGDYDHFYIKVRFVDEAKELRDELVEGENHIAIENAFLSCESYKRKKMTVTVPVLVVTAAELLDDDEEAPKSGKKSDKKSGKKSAKKVKDEEDEENEEDDEDDVPF